MDTVVRSVLTIVVPHGSKAGGSAAVSHILGGGALFGGTVASGPERSDASARGRVTDQVGIGVPAQVRVDGPEDQGKLHGPVVDDTPLAEVEDLGESGGEHQQAVDLKAEKVALKIIQSEVINQPINQLIALNTRAGSVYPKNRVLKNGYNYFWIFISKNGKD